MVICLTINWCSFNDIIHPNIFNADWRETSDCHQQDTSWLPQHPNNKYKLVHEDPNMSAYDFFSSFFPIELYQIIATHTNLYAQQWLDSHQPLLPNSRMKMWHETTSDEIKAFISIEIAIGLTVTADQTEH